MPTEGSAPLVGVAILSRKQLGEGFESARSSVEALARGWRDRRNAKDVKGRDLVWTWVDGDKWGAWAKSMYGVDGTSSVALLVADPLVSSSQTTRRIETNFIWSMRVDIGVLEK